MSFVDKVKDNQRMIWTVLGGLATGYLLFKLVEGRPKVETPEQRRKRQIQLLKRQLNVQNPSFEDIKKVMEFAIHEAKIKVAQFSRVFKEKRMKYNRLSRKENFRQYLTLVAQGTQEMQMIAIQEQTNLLKELGISEAHFRKFDKLLDKAMQEIMNIESKDISHLTPMKLEQAKFALRQQIDFIKQEGLEYAQLIIDATRDWSRQQKASLPLLLSTIVTDSAFESYPLIDADSVEHAESQYERELMGELQELQVAMAPMMIKINNAIREVKGFDLADFKNAEQRMDYEQASKLREFQRSRGADQPLF